MDHTIALIRRAHEGDENARAQLVEENTGLIWCVVKDLRTGHRGRGFISDRKHRAFKSDR